MTEPRLSSDPSDPRTARITEAREVLRGLNFDDERCNERSALVFLALLGLGPDTPWAQATNPMLRTVDIMEFARTHHSKDYKPNSRETIRRRTLHQFVDAALVLENPDDPKRATNSPKWCYQIERKTLTLLRNVGTDTYPAKLRTYLTEVPGLKDLYANARKLQRIPVTLPDGKAIVLSPGGQNPLIKQMIEEFCAYYTPGGQVLYIGDSDAKWMLFERNALEALGVVVDSHGKMPDLVVYMPDKKWLVLMEAAASHGPVDAKRHRELKTLFADSTAGLVFVSCFPNRAQMRKYLAEIAWETEVWCADHPTHLIHFNGERLLGPYS